MRKINTADLVKCARIIKRAGLKQEIENIIEQSKSIKMDDEKAVEKMGIDIILSLIFSCCEENVVCMIYELIAEINQSSADDIPMLELDELTRIITEISKQNNLVNFFKQASRLMS